jgi:AcrR family transcriptional regulator
VYHKVVNIVTSIPTDARQVRTRSTLLEALLHLLETRPFDQITIREIAKEAGIGYATFFRHYPSKEALLHDLAAGEIAALLEHSLPVLFAVDTRRSCMALFSYVDERRALWSALLTGGAAALLKAEFTAQAKQLAEASGAVGGWLPDELKVVFSTSASVEIIAWWLHQDPDFGIERIAEILDRLVVAPVLAAN